MIPSHAEHESSREESTRNSRINVLLSTGSREGHKVGFKDSYPSSRVETIGFEISGLFHHQRVCLLGVAMGCFGLCNVSMSC